MTDLAGSDAWRIDSFGVIAVRDCGLYSGGATEGRWFDVGDLHLDADLVDELIASSLEPVGWWARYYTRMARCPA